MQSSTVMAHLSAPSRPAPILLGAQRLPAPCPTALRASGGANAPVMHPLAAAVLGATLLVAPAALAQEAVGLEPAAPPPTTTSVDAALPTDVSQLLKDYPTLPFAGAFLVGAPLVFTAANRGGGKVKSASPDGAYAALASEDKAVLLDIRSIAQRASGSPDLKGLKKKAVLQLPFTKACHMPLHAVLLVAACSSTRLYRRPQHKVLVAMALQHPLCDCGCSLPAGDEGRSGARGGLCGARRQAVGRQRGDYGCRP